MFKICNALILLFLFLDYLFSFCFSEEETKLNITENYLNNTNKTYFHLDNNLLKKKKLFFPQNLINNRLKLPKKTKKHNNHNYKIIKSNNYKYPNYLLKEINNDYIRKKLNELVRKSEYEIAGCRIFDQRGARKPREVIRTSFLIPQRVL